MNWVSFVVCWKWHILSLWRVLFDLNIIIIFVVIISGFACNLNVLLVLELNIIFIIILFVIVFGRSSLFDLNVFVVVIIIVIFNLDHWAVFKLHIIIRVIIVIIIFLHDFSCLVHQYSHLSHLTVQLLMALHPCLHIGQQHLHGSHLTVNFSGGVNTWAYHGSLTSRHKEACNNCSKWELHFYVLKLWFILNLIEIN